MYTKHVWEKEGRQAFPYLQYLPEDYDPRKTYPLIVFLHGAGERGSDPDAIASHGPFRYIREQGREYPCILVAPQCPVDRVWPLYPESLVDFTRDMCETLSADMSRVYVTGLSMGGDGTWALTAAAPDMFAAICPICSFNMDWLSYCLPKIPMRLYHGDKDPVVPFANSVTMTAALEKAGRHVDFHVCTGWGHNSWEVAYENDEAIDWLLKQKKV